MVDIIPDTRGTFNWRKSRTPLDLPLALFVASGLVGIWASYDPTTSWQKFALIVAAVAIYYGVVMARGAPQMLSIFVWLFLFGCAALAIYFVAQHDYSNEPGKFGFITSLGLLLNRISPQLPFHHFQPNIVSGALEIALPVNMALVLSNNAKVKSKKAKGKSELAFSLFTFALITFGLVMTSSRGAWLALGLVAVFAILAAFATDGLKRYALPLALITFLVCVIVALRLGETLAPTIESVLGAVPAGDIAISRLELSSQVWSLIQDYYFTGAGLGVFSMVYSTYALLIDVPFLTHAHNLFLEVWIEQGLLGFVAFVWLIVEFYMWAWRSRAALSWLALGGIIAATVMLLHGFGDVLLYSSRELPLMFVPMGIAIASHQSLVISRQRADGSRQSSVVSSQYSANNRSALHAPRCSSFAIALAVLAALVLLVAVAWKPIAAMWNANLGSVAQTRAELAGFPTADWKAGAVRRNGDLSQAQAYFQQALAFDVGNLTANQRLGAIASARGEYDAAREYFARVYARDPMNTTTWRMEANLDAAIGLQTEACQIASQAKALGWSGAWRFSLPQCATK